MKKLFVAVLALAALAACNKEVDTVLNTSKKSVTISIANAGDVTRVEGGTTAPGEAVACADAKDLQFLFADATGKIVEIRTVAHADTTTDTEGATAADGTFTAEYTFHKLPETVMMMAVSYNATSAVVGAQLKAVYDEWVTETVDIEYDQIVAFSTDADPTATDDYNSFYGIDLKDANTCAVAPHENVEYPLYTAAVRVAPAHARIEVTKIACTDLGVAEYGYKSALLKTLTLASEKYVHTLNHTLTIDANSYELADSKVWSWNILPQNVSDMVLNIEVTGKQHNVSVPEKTVTVNEYFVNGTKIDAFEAENIYRLDLSFVEANIDATNAYICVNVDVTVAPWIINVTKVGFETGPDQQ